MDSSLNASSASTAAAVQGGVKEGSESSIQSAPNPNLSSEPSPVINGAEQPKEVKGLSK